VAEALAELIASGDLGYPWLGEPDQPNEVAVAFCEWAGRRYDWSIDAGAVVVTVDVLQPLTAMVELCSSPGDGVIIQTPIYPPFLRTLELTGRTLIDNPLGPAAQGSPLDVDGLLAAVAAHPSPRVLLLCNPHNPTGRVFDADEREAIARVVAERDLLLISDEVWADLTHPGHRHVPMATVDEEVASRTITISSASKAFNLAGLRCAVAHIGSATLQARLDALPPHTLGAVGSPGAEAAVACWTEGHDWLAVTRSFLTDRRDQLAKRVAEDLPGVGLQAPDATYLAWLDLSALDLGDEPQEWLLQRARVGLSPGGDFGPGGQGFVRLNTATSAEMLDRLVDRMVEALAVR
jgi:cystathionine beta-lyase